LPLFTNVVEEVFSDVHLEAGLWRAKPRPSRFSTDSLWTVNLGPIDRTYGVGKYLRESEERSVEMPYKQITQLPDSVKNNLPKHAQEIYKEAFNSAEEQYGEESRAHRVAWSAVENKYEKNENGRWVSKES
jgi:cation transport regulator